MIYIRNCLTFQNPGRVLKVFNLVSISKYVYMIHWMYKYNTRKKLKYRNKMSDMLRILLNVSKHKLFGRRKIRFRIFLFFFLIRILPSSSKFLLEIVDFYIFGSKGISKIQNISILVLVNHCTILIYRKMNPMV